MCTNIAKAVSVCNAKEQNLFTNYRKISIYLVCQSTWAIRQNRLLNSPNRNGYLYPGRYGFLQVLKNAYTLGMFLNITKAFIWIEYKIFIETRGLWNTGGGGGGRAWKV